MKRRLDLGTDEGKGKLVRHCLALATTRVSGRRFLVVGYEDATLAFAETPGPKVTKERVEQILHAYTDPTPDIRFRRLKVPGGEAVLIELVRDPARVPYRVSKAIGPLAVGDVYVRHGTSSEDPTARELRELEQEGRAAQGK